MDYGLAYQTYCEYYVRGPPGEVDLEAPCFVCWYDISSPVRKCMVSLREDIPNIGIHDLCAELPSEMEDHPFHSHHTLTLRTITSCDSGATLCDACGRFISWGFYFCCEMCEFHLDPHCATLLTRYDTKYGIEFLEHPHQLMHCWNRGQASNLCCSGCKEPFGMDIYVCLDCHCLLDQCCADTPSRIRHPFHLQNPLTLDKSWAKWAHPFHPNHPLTLLVKHDPDSSRCNACGKELEGLIFYCSECEFGLDLVCAALMPAPVNHLQLGHPHRLILCEKNETFNFTCYACQLRIKDSFCICWECHIFLHRSCANLPWIVHRLPHQKHANLPWIVQRRPHQKRSSRHFKVPKKEEEEKKHSSHCQHHTLTLLLDHLPCKQFVYVPEMHPLHPKYNGDIVQQAVGPTQPHERNVHSKCPECSRLTTGFAYTCSECSDYFGISCTLKKSLPHKHPLAYFNIKSNKLKCESCRRSLLTPFFRCEECNFNIHVSCISILPQIVKHRCHRHVLSLRYSPVRDFPDEDENAEFYCDICEEHRYLLDPTYYCEECHFVSHVHCAIKTSEEMHALVEEWSLPFKLESQKYADKQKGPALESLASVDEATGVSVEELEAEGSRVAENRLSIIKQDEEIAVLREEILCLETKLSDLDERKKELERGRASNFRLTRTRVMF